MKRMKLLYFPGESWCCSGCLTDINSHRAGISGNRQLPQAGQGLASFSWWGFMDQV